MTAFVAFLRAVNVGGNRGIRMTELKALCEGLGFASVTTHLQSGNVVFGAGGSDKGIAKKLEAAILRARGFHSDVMVRTTSEMAGVIERNPFRVEETNDPSHLVVAFMRNSPEAGAHERLAALKTGPERIILDSRELYLYYPDGIGKSKLTNAVLERALGGTPVTGRNWNTVTKLLQLARELEA